MKRVISAVYLSSLLIFSFVFVVKDKIKEIETDTWKEIQTIFLGLILGITVGLAVYFLKPERKSND